MHKVKEFVIKSSIQFVSFDNIFMAKSAHFVVVVKTRRVSINTNGKAIDFLVCNSHRHN